MTVRLEFEPLEIQPGGTLNVVRVVPPGFLFRPEKIVLDAVSGTLAELAARIGREPKTVHDLSGDDALGSLSVLDILIGRRTQIPSFVGSGEGLPAKLFAPFAVSGVLSLETMNVDVQFHIKIKNASSGAVVVAGTVFGEAKRREA